MSIKAKLRIQLFAEEVLVAESQDADLWRRVLSAIQGGQPLEDAAAPILPVGGSIGPAQLPGAVLGGSALEKFAEELGATVDQVQGACSPELEPPYLHLDPKSWEAFRRNTPKRGASAIGPILVAATLQCLWFKYGAIEGKPTQALAKQALDTIGAKDPNASRSIKNCEWLQSRADGLVLHPAKFSRAVAVARAYVTESPVESE